MKTLLILLLGLAVQSFAYAKDKPFRDNSPEGLKRRIDALIKERPVVNQIVLERMQEEQIKLLTAITNAGEAIAFAKKLEVPTEPIAFRIPPDGGPMQIVAVEAASYVHNYRNPYGYRNSFWGGWGNSYPFGSGLYYPSAYAPSFYPGGTGLVFPSSGTTSPLGGGQGLGYPASSVPMSGVSSGISFPGTGVPAVHSMQPGLAHPSISVPPVSPGGSGLSYPR